MAQDSESRTKTAQAFNNAIETFVSFFERAEKEKASKAALGLWADDGKIGWGDITAAPWIVRADIVLRYYKGFEFPPGERLAAYLKRLLNHPLVKKTTSTDDLYLDSYER
jgi:glutathione S-transferase